MIPYKSYRYLFPPRPENAMPSSSLQAYDTGKYIAQPKLNGDCMLVFTNGKETIVMNRHKEEFSKSIKLYPSLKKLHRETISDNLPNNKWMVLVGEYMAKSQKNEKGEVWNDKYVIFDIIVYDGMQLIGKTFQERQNLLDVLYGKNESALLPEGVYTDKFLWATEVPDVFRVKNFYECFSTMYDDLVKIGMYEGLVLKRSDAKLENGLSQKNNTATMLKFRKATKNYSY